MGGKNGWNETGRDDTRPANNHAPIFHIRTPGERMAYDHHIIPPLIQPPPRLVRNRHLSKSLPAFKSENREDEDFLVNLDEWRHLFPKLPKRRASMIKRR